MKNIFSAEDVQHIIDRINQLSPDTERQWGKMEVAQMLAHCNVAYEGVYESKHPKATGFKRLMLKWFVKPIVVGPKPYKKNSRTAPEYLIDTPRDFETEKNRLVNYLKKTQELGESHFDNKDSQSFGPLSVKEWNLMFYKHLDHHLTQFGV